MPGVLVCKDTVLPFDTLLHSRPRMLWSQSSCSGASTGSSGKPKNVLDVRRSSATSFHFYLSQDHHSYDSVALKSHLSFQNGQEGSH